MHKGGALSQSIYVIGLLLTALTINRKYTLAEFSNDNLFRKLSYDDGDDFDDGENENFGFVELEKRDVIKGPSFIPNIDATTADDELSLEDDEVSEEGSRRLNIAGQPYHNIKPKNNIEDNLDTIETLMKDDSDSWEPGQHIKGIAHLLHHKKSLREGSRAIINEHAVKKNSFSKLKQGDDDIPKVIKALYDWKLDAIKGSRKSKISSNLSSDDDKSTDDQEKKSSYAHSPSMTEHASARSETPEAADSSKLPFVTEHGMAVDDEESEAEPVVPAFSVTGNARDNIAEKKRKKINLLVNLNINELPGRRSKVGSSQRLGSSFFTLSTETESADKRHRFRHHRGRRRRLRAHALRKTLKEEAAESGDGSGSGAAEATTYFPETYLKTSATAPVANTAPVQDTAAPASPNTVYPAQTQATNVNTNTQDASATPYTSQVYTGYTTDTRAAQGTADNTQPQNTDTQYNYLNYHAAEKSGDDDTEASGSGHVLTYGLRSKELNNKELSYKAKVVLGYADKNETKAAYKENEASEKEQSSGSAASKESENQYLTKNAEVKEGESADATATNEGSTEQHDDKTENAERNEAVDSAKDQQSSEAHKEDSEQTDKAKTFLSNLTNQAAQADETMSSKKEKQEESVATDGTDNLKKKSGQEDKYETLEEVREKFKKWESKIIKMPSEIDESSAKIDEDAPAKETESSGPTAKDTESSGPTAKDTESSGPTAKDTESSGPTAKDTESSGPTAKDTESSGPTARSEDGSSSGTKPDESAAPSAKESESVSPTAKTDESNSAATKAESNGNAALKSEESNNAATKTPETKAVKSSEQTDEKKADDSGKGKAEFFTEKKVSSLVTAAKEGEEKTTVEPITEKASDDLVKELIGLPSKEAKKTDSSQKDNVETAAKATQDTKQEKETSDAKAVTSSDKSKEGEEKGQVPKAGSEEKFNIDEVNKKNSEHHDLPDSDMKESPEKMNLKSEEMSNLNSSNVPEFNERASASEEKPIAETAAASTAGTATSTAGSTAGSTMEEKTTTQETISDEKSQTPAKEEKTPAKPTTATQAASSVETKHKKQPATAEEKPAKQSAEKKAKKPTPTSEEKSGKQATKEASEFTSEDKSNKKTTTEEPTEGSTEFTIDQEKPLTNPMIAKEANEFSNEQEKSFASAIEKIKAQEEKLKGKEISSEIQEIKDKEVKTAESETEGHEEKFHKDTEEEAGSSPKTTKKHETKKPSEKNLKQLRLYKHQILSEVEKIDDLMSEYQKDGHSTKELSEAKEVLENDLKLVKELERNTKKKSSTVKKDREHLKQIMPSSAYLNTANEESKEQEVTHRDKTSSVDSKSLAKSLEKEAERNEKQLENLIPSYEYYFHSDAKPSVKHPKKQSLEEIHKLLKAEIKRLRQKKNGKADNQLKNIRKLVQQHLKKLISTGDIDKTAFHSLAPEIKQLGELLKERIKSLKKKKIARKLKVKKFKEHIQSIKKKPNDLQQSLESSAANQLGTNVHHHLQTMPKGDRLEPPLASVKGEDTNHESGPPQVVDATSHEGSETAQIANSKPVDNKPMNESVLAALPDNSKVVPEGKVDQAQNINIKNLLKTLNEKLGSVYQKAKTAHDLNYANNPAAQSSPETVQHQEQQKHRTNQYEAAIPSPPAAAANQQYNAQKQVPSTHAASVASNNSPSSSLHLGDQRQNVETVSAPNPPVVDATETQQVTPVTTTTDVQQAMGMDTNAAMPADTTTSAAVGNNFQEVQAPAAPAPQQSLNLQPEATPTPQADSKADLPMVPEDPEFEEDNTEALASLEPINTLVETLEKDITELWSYKDLYPNAEALGLDNEKVHNTYANLGSLSGLSLRRALNRALRGEDVGLGVVGGSISKGGPFSEKGLEYVLRSYFYAIEDYWNKVIRPITGSSMIVRDVSLGGISTDYYSFCIRNHLPDDKLTNIVLWELSANDMRRYDDSLKPKPQPLEQFTRNILTYRAKPSLIFVNFFALFDWDPDLRANCRNFEDEGEDDVAKYYKITSLSWRNMVCPLLKADNSPIFTRNNLFAEDHFHPSILGHAQMSYIIIDYIRTEFLKNLVKMRPFFIGDAVEKLQIPRSIYMPRPMFKETFLWKPLCYTYMLVDNRLPNNTMPLHEENESDFKYTVVRGFKIRSDKIAGMETKLKDQFIRYKLQIPRHEDASLTPFKQLGIMSFTDDRYAEIQFDSQHPTRLEAKKRFLEGTVVKTIAENIEPGDHTLTVRSGDSGFLICALVLG